ncbi:MAG: alpha-ketoglutarate-dependent dioxygenase AlkB [Rickettsiales bacterium]
MKQLGLFEEEIKIKPNSVISGLGYIPDFIDENIEAELIKTIDAQTWKKDLKRQVQHYGYAYDYKARKVTTESKLGDIPQWLQVYCKKLKNDGFFEEIPDQVIINEYQIGQGISAHIDCVPCFGATIAIISLGSPCVMDFTNSQTAEKDSLLLEQRSLTILSGDARYICQHAIANRKTDKYDGEIIQRNRRVSLTFRTVII